MKDSDSDFFLSNITALRHLTKKKTSTPLLEDLVCWTLSAHTPIVTFVIGPGFSELLLFSSSAVRPGVSRTEFQSGNHDVEENFYADSSSLPCSPHISCYPLLLQITAQCATNVSPYSIVQLLKIFITFSTTVCTGYRTHAKSFKDDAVFSKTLWSSPAKDTSFLPKFLSHIKIVFAEDVALILLALRVSANFSDFIGYWTASTSTLDTICLGYKFLSAFEGRNRFCNTFTVYFLGKKLLPLPSFTGLNLTFKAFAAVRCLQL